MKFYSIKEKAIFVTFSLFFFLLLFLGRLHLDTGQKEGLSCIFWNDYPAWFMIKYGIMWVYVGDCYQWPIWKC